MTGKGGRREEAEVAGGQVTGPLVWALSICASRPTPQPALSPGKLMVGPLKPLSFLKTPDFCLSVIFICFLPNSD